MDLMIDNNGLQVRQPVRTEKPQAVSGTETTAADAEVQKAISLAHTTDRVEISAEGRAALAQSAVVSAEQTQEIQPAQEQTAEIAQAARAAAPSPPAGAQAAAGPADGSAAGEQDTAVATAAETAEAATETDEAALESADTSSSNNLAMLTEQQIDDLVADGTITQSEANAELARRAAAKEQQAASASETLETAAAQAEQA